MRRPTGQLEIVGLQRIRMRHAVEGVTGDEHIILVKAIHEGGGQKREILFHVSRRSFRPQEFTPPLPLSPKSIGQALYHRDDRCVLP